MHPINKLLSYFGVQLYRSKRQAGFPPEFRKTYAREFNRLKNNPPAGFEVRSEIMYEEGEHPFDSVDAECAFAAKHIFDIRPKKILDIGSYRHFILGLLAEYFVTTLDIRPREPVLKNETIIVGDTKKLNLPDGSFDLVLSLCTIEHLGLGRYGDEIDLDADQKAVREIARVLSHGGYFIFSTEITRAKPQIAFNSHRIYDHKMICDLCELAGFILKEEAFFSRSKNGFCSLSEITREPKKRDVYMGLWVK